VLAVPLLVPLAILGNLSLARPTGEDYLGLTATAERP
jgi:hypothetical protein